MPVRVCDSCGVACVCDSVNTHLIENGVTLTFRELGYYGGFVDNAPWEELNSETELLNICEECVVTWLRALPGLTQKLQKRYPCEENLKMI